jgi:hypothetical protein
MLLYKQRQAAGQFRYKTYDRRNVIMTIEYVISNRSGIPFKLHWLVVLDDGHDDDDDPFPIFPLSDLHLSTTRRSGGDSFDGPTNCSNTQSRNKVQRTDVHPFREQWIRSEQSVSEMTVTTVCFLHKFLYIRNVSYIRRQAVATRIQVIKRNFSYVISWKKIT